MFPIIIFTTIFIALIIACVQDIKTREVPDWLNFSLIAAGLGIRLIYSLANFDWSYVINGLLGFTIFLILALAMFYSGQWGGGDSKLLMGLGALIGFDIAGKFDNLLFLFLVNVLLIGALYGLLWSIWMAIKKRKLFVKKFKKLLSKNKKIRSYLFALALILLITIFFVKDILITLTIFALIFAIIFTFYVWIFTKAVEETCMYKYISPLKLTEGDWIVKDIYYKKKKICGKKDLGINKKQINELIKLYKKNIIKKVLIKEGIPFTPTFLIAMIISLLLGNWILLLI